MAALGLPHATGAGHDPDCAIVIVAHDAAAHQMRAPGLDDTTQPVHCLACHWARSFRPRAEATYMPAVADDVRTPLHLDVAPVAAANTVAQPPLRSPPLAPIAA